MLIIEYCENGESVSDFECSDWLLTVLNTKTDRHFKVSTSLPISFIRLAIAKNQLSCHDVTFVFKENRFQANEYGAITNWPLGFCDIEIEVCNNIIFNAMKKRKLM